MTHITQDDHDMFNHLENHGMIDAIALDQVIFKSKFESLFISGHRLWQKFIRSI